LPQLLKNNGYATGLIGKWHLGYKPEFGPNAHGFDYFFGFLSGFIDFYTHTRGDGLSDLFENTTPIHQDGYMTDLITDRAVRFIEQRAGAPFFLEVAYNAAHWPFQPPDHYSKAPNNAAFQGPADAIPATRKDYVAMLERADVGVGQILRKLDALGLAKNTLVIFTNDNGGEWLSRNAPLFHRKDTLRPRPKRRSKLVRTPLSSRNTRCVRSHAGMRARQAVRDAATSARSCSEGRTVFFNGEIQPIDGAPDRRETRGRAERLAQLGQGPIGLLLDERGEPILLARQDRRAPRRLLPWGELPRFPSSLLQRVDPRATDVIACGELFRHHSRVAVAYDPRPQIHRVRSGHRASCASGVP
jgi:arylsulfatase A-like enzyme